MKILSLFGNRHSFSKNNFRFILKKKESLLCIDIIKLLKCSRGQKQKILWFEQAKKLQLDYFYCGNLLLIQKFENLQKMQKVKDLVKMTDFFNSFQMLRYEQEAQYRTFTGGLISIGVIITIIIAFASMIIDTVNRTSINFSLRSQRQVNPPLTTLVNSPDGNYMFGIQVWGYNLSEEYRIFDVVLEQVHSTYGQDYIYTPLPLVPCTRQHWAKYPDVLRNFESLKMSGWLCPQIGLNLLLQGRYSSKDYYQLQINLYRCSNDTDPNRPCGSTQKLQQFMAQQGQWNYFTYYTINSVINADQPEYLKYYLEDRTFIVFSDRMGQQYNMYMKGITINSDNSIWPFTDINEEYTYNMDFSPILYPFGVDNTTSFATFYIMKEPTEEFYVREVQKIFVVFSFMGGLIGAIMAALFIINAYTSFAFELALSVQVFRDKQQKKSHEILQAQHESPCNLNIFQFIKYQSYVFAKKIKCNIINPQFDYITQCRDEIVEQLDIKNLVKRMIFLQFAISFLFEDYQLMEIQKQKPTLPKEIERLRRKIQSSGDPDQLQQSEGSQGSMYEHKQQKMPAINLKTQYKDGSYRGFDSAPKLKFSQPSMVHRTSFDPQPRDLLEPPSGSNMNNLHVYDQNNLSNRIRKENAKKIFQSASNGNIVSKKLLRVIKYSEASQITSSKRDQIQA